MIQAKNYKKLSKFVKFRPTAKILSVPFFRTRCTYKVLLIYYYNTHHLLSCFSSLCVTVSAALKAKANAKTCTFEAKAEAEAKDRKI